MHRGDYESWFTKAGMWSSNHKTLVLVVTVALAAFVVGKCSTSAKAAGITVSGNAISVPECATFTAAAQNSVVNLAVTCNPAVTPPVPPVPPVAGPGCAGFSPIIPVEIAWPTVGNINQPFPVFPPNSAIVVHFKTPALGVNDSAIFTMANTSGPNYSTVRTSLASVPGCNTPTKYPPVAPVMWAGVSQTPPLYLTLVPSAGMITVKPSTDYWVTIVNRNGYPGSVSCANPDCGIGRRFDFNH
jgi:hypothetical protein